MTAPLKQAADTVCKPPRPTTKQADAGEMHERVSKRFPKTMARLGE